MAIDTHSGLTGLHQEGTGVGFSVRRKRRLKRWGPRGFCGLCGINVNYIQIRARLPALREARLSPAYHLYQT